MDCFVFSGFDHLTVQKVDVLGNLRFLRCYFFSFFSLVMGKFTWFDGRLTITLTMIKTLILMLLFLTLMRGFKMSLDIIKKILKVEFRPRI